MIDVTMNARRYRHTLETLLIIVRIIIIVRHQCSISAIREVLLQTTITLGIDVSCEISIIVWDYKARSLP